MITKKYWNSLTRSSKKHILDVLNTSGESVSAKLLEPYNHDFDYDMTGKVLRDILSCCYLQKDGQLKIVMYTKVIVDTNKSKSLKSPIKQTLTKTCVTPVESTYYVDYEDKSGDLCHVWVMATSKDDARAKALDEYWDINEIIRIFKE